ncbi:MAG: lipoprotein-releasing ABC transporter permease subunit [Burkholderiaceae bacterium]
MIYELQLGLRYIRGGRGRGFVNFISAMATMGIALGVAALIMVLSVMNGFQTEVRDRMLGVLSHVEVRTPGYSQQDWLAVQSALRHTQPGLQSGQSPFVSGQAMLTRGDQMRGVMLRGIEPSTETGVTQALSQLQAGRLDSLKPGEFQAVIGRELAIAMGLGLGETFQLVVADLSGGPAGLAPKTKAFKVAGIFASGHYEYDSSLIFVHRRDAGVFLRDQATEGLRIALKDMQAARGFAAELSTRLDRSFVVRDWTQENRNWFAAVELEKRMMFIILMLIIAVAAFNLVSMLVMTVMDKRGDIAILRTMGAQPRSILLIFMTQGLCLGVVGVAVGTLLGVLGAWQIDAVVGFFEGLFGFQVLPKGIYLIDRLPSDLRWSDVGQISVTALLLSFVSTLYPSYRAAATQPAQALRYE